MIVALLVYWSDYLHLLVSHRALRRRCRVSGWDTGRHAKAIQLHACELIRDHARFSPEGIHVRVSVIQAISWPPVLTCCDIPLALSSCFRDVSRQLHRVEIHTIYQLWDSWSTALAHIRMRSRMEDSSTKLIRFGPLQF